MSEINCYLCQSTQIRVIRNTLRHNVKRDVLECTECGLVYLAAKAEKSGSLQDYYATEYRKQFSPAVTSAFDSKQIFDMYIPYQAQRIERIKNHLNASTRLLDIGCSAGHFLSAVKPHVGEVVGMEFNLDNVKFVRENLNIEAYSEPLEKTDLKPASFDVITAFQMFEHVEDPLSFLRTLHKYLKPNGVLCIEIPNLHDVLVEHYQIKPYADFYYREPHLFYYSPKTIMKISEETGFKGSVKSIQRYNLMNQMNWLLKQEPQKDADTGMRAPKLPNFDSHKHPALARDLDTWLQKANHEYFEIVNRYMMGESLLYIGHKQ
jgi:2-polyprenyl-3-methyl-5-hydroxy-6-metoxy-1,4-benzoquinol methylase